MSVYVAALNPEGEARSFFSIEYARRIKGGLDDFSPSPEAVGIDYTKRHLSVFNPFDQLMAKFGVVLSVARKNFAPRFYVEHFSGVMASQAAIKISNLGGDLRRHDWVAASAVFGILADQSRFSFPVMGKGRQDHPFCLEKLTSQLYVPRAKTGLKFEEFLP